MTLTRAKSPNTQNDGCKRLWHLTTAKGWKYKGAHTFKRPSSAVAFLRRRFPGCSIQFDPEWLDEDGGRGVIGEDGEGVVFVGEISAETSVADCRGRG